jgi:chromosome segregation ATPase
VRNEQNQDHKDTMGDSAEFEKLSALEARLREAIERIARGVEGRAAAPDISGALEQAQARVTRAEEARDAAEAALEAAKSAGEQAAKALRERVAVVEGDLVKARAREADAKTRADDLQDRLTAREADAREHAEARARLETRVAELEAELAKVSAMPDQSAEIAHLERRVKRARAERDAMVAARDAAQDAADELAETMGVEPDQRVVALRGEVRRLKALVDQMSTELDGLRNAQGPRGVEGVNRALEAQVAALTEARRAEAAELDRILGELAGTGAPAGGV